jgi:hypothetical protein
MTRKYIILFLFVLLVACEKSNDQPDTLLKFYGDAYEDIGYSIAKVDDGYIITGQFTEITRSEANYIDKSRSKMTIIKAGSDGNTIWKKSFGDNFPAIGKKVLTLADGSVICTGYVIDTITQKRDLFVVKLSADGSGSEQKIFYKYNSNQYGNDIIETPEGFMILGTTDVAKPASTDFSGNISGNKDILILRIDNSLNKLGEISHGFPGNDEGLALKADRNGGYIVVGTTDRSEPEQELNNIFLLRVNADGSATYPSIIGGAEDEYAADIEVLNDGYLIAGTVGSEGADQNGYIWKIPNNIYDAPTSKHEIVIENTSFSINAISRYKTNSFVMAGKTGSGSSAKMLIFATDADGYMVENKVMVAGSTGAQVAYDVISEADGNIVAVGKSSYENNSMISLLKFKF